MSVDKAFRVAIHVGFRKTATTWLQEHIFSNHPKINYLGKTSENYPPWLIRWHYLDDYAYEQEKPDIEKTIKGLLEKDRLNLISSEAFTNTGVIYSQARRIHGISPRAKIIITIRNPIDMIISHYKNDVNDGIYILGLEEYLDWKRTPYDLIKRRPIYLPDFFFDETMDIYTKLFGKRNVCILRYEEMLSSSTSYFHILGEFLQVQFTDPVEKLKMKVNEGVKEYLIKEIIVKNALRFMAKNFPNSAAQISSEDIAVDVDGHIMTDELRQRLISYFGGRCCGYY
jgi:hypothetical protein